MSGPPPGRISGAILVAGTTSDAGKSLVTTGICRWLARRGVRVAPFKSQNMSNNSMVCPDGGEIGRAQWLQAVAAGAEPEVAFNPVLLKPGSDRRSHIVLMGRSAGHLEAGEFATGRTGLAKVAFAAFDDLRERFDVVVAEGAGSPTEINLRPGDYVNLGLARHGGLPTIVVGDIDRGGVLAAMYGTLALLDEADQRLLAGWVVNKFRGDVEVLRPGLRTLAERTGRPVLGVIPWLDGVWVDSEDALAVAGWGDRPAPVTGTTLRVAVVRFPRVSNATDVDALALEPGVVVTVTTDPDVVAAADVVVLPGSRATVTDLAWLRATGLADVVARRAAAGRPVLGICGGYQMLARTIADDVESGAGRVDGLGLLPTTVRFGASKVLGRPVGGWRGHRISAYEIHHGVAALDAAAWDRTPLDQTSPDQTPLDQTSPDQTPSGTAGPSAGSPEPFLDGWRLGAVWGTTWHGAFENDGFRRAWLTEAARQAGVAWAATDGPGFGEHREAMIDALADAVEEHLDTDHLLGLIASAGSFRADAGPPT